MKKTAYIFILILATAVTACKGFLDVTPTNKVSADQ